jgi:hypothetical protein
MINRTFKFYGQAFSASGLVSIVAKFNGQQVYSGTIPTIASSDPQQPGDQNIVMFEYTGPIDIHGHIPFELTVTGGTVCFGRLTANYSSVDLSFDKSDPNNHVVVVNVAPEDFWDDVNTNNAETDGKTNVQINGVEQIRQVVDPVHGTGDWWYKILDSQTMTCSIFVDSTKILIRAPTNEEARAINDVVKSINVDNIPRAYVDYTPEEKSRIDAVYQPLRLQ